MLVAYKMAPSTYHLLKLTKAFKAKYFSLPNIIADKPLVPEVLQKQVVPEHLAATIQYWLDNATVRQNLQDEFYRLHQGLQKNTNQQVAQLILDSLYAIEVG